MQDQAVCRSGLSDVTHQDVQQPLQQYFHVVIISLFKPAAHSLCTNQKRLAREKTRRRVQVVFSSSGLSFLLAGGESDSGVRREMVNQ